MKPKTETALRKRDLTQADIDLAIRRTMEAKSCNTPDAVRFVAKKFLLSIAEVDDARTRRESAGAGT